MGTIEALLNSNIRLPSPPAIAVRILEAVKKDDLSFAELASIIQADPALTARILKIANSSYYALPSKVTSIERALSVLGVDALKNIALSFVITNDLKGHGEGAFDFDYFWKRSITAAVAAELTAALVRKKSGDTFVTALLQDIGVIILYFCRPNDYLQVLDEKSSSGEPVEAVERQVFGFDHQEVGSEILRRWGLPESIYLPIGCHHPGCEIPEEYRDQSAILLISDRISAIYHGNQGYHCLHDIRAILGGTYGIGDSEIDQLIDSVAGKSVEILSSFEIDPGAMKPFSQILQEANEELSQLNISYEMLVMELKQARDKAEKLANELKSANEKLREMAFRDGLTGLVNHRFFQETMDEEMERAQRYGRPFSLVMFDIDHFKKVNDTYGHPRGDQVLKALSSLVQEMTRNTDVAARYGGEEFALILTETPLEGAMIVAERVRRAVEQLVIEADDLKIRVTVSIGVASYLPNKSAGGKAALIEAADQALYTSKKSGRNRVTRAFP